jgi:hypothetical protein
VKRLLGQKRQGSAVLLVLIAVMILLAMGMSLLSLGANSRIYSTRTARDIAARCAADSGLTMALFEMNKKLKVKPWNDNSLPGAVVARSFEQKNSGTFNYDALLRDASVNDQAILFVVTNWYEQ